MKRNGFTLIEVMMALIVFSIGITAVLKLQISAVNANYNSYYLQTANNAMNNRIEKLLSQDYEDIVSQQEEEPDFSNPDFKTAWTVTSDNPEPGIKQINVTVKWKKTLQKHTLDYMLYKKEY